MKKILALVLLMTLALTSVPAAVFAAGGSEIILDVTTQAAGGLNGLQEGDEVTVRVLMPSGITAASAVVQADFDKSVYEVISVTKEAALMAVTSAANANEKGFVAGVIMSASDIVYEADTLLYTFVLRVRENALGSSAISIDSAGTKAATAGKTEVQLEAPATVPTVIVETVKYTVSFDSDGGSAVASQTVKSGEAAEMPESPTMSGFDFDGWYDGLKLYDFSEPVTRDIELVAQWTKVHVHSLTAVPAKEATCESAGNTAYWQCTGCGKYFSDAAASAEISKNSWVLTALGHDWTKPVYEWAADNKSVTASRACKNDGSHMETETVVAVYTIESAAKCTVDGTGRYTSEKFSNKAFSTQFKDVTIPATGHDYDFSNPAYVWNSSDTKATATAQCTHNAAHKYTEVAAAVSEVTKPATCVEEGVRTYTASFTKFAPATKTVSIDKTDHTPAEAVQENLTAPTSTKDGSCDEVVYCSVCHTEISRTPKTLPATHREKRTLTRKDSAKVEIEVATDSGKVSVEGDMSVEAPVLVASYDEDGRFVGIVFVPAAITVDPGTGTRNIQVFWIDEEARPLSEAADVELE